MTARFASNRTANVRRRRAPRRGIRGQATAEMAIGLISIMVAFVGLLQIARLGFENVRTSHDARAKVDELMMNGGTPGGASDLGTWTTGDDGLRYTQDDSNTPLVQTIEAFTDPLANGSMPLEDINVDTQGVTNSINPTLSSGSLAFAAQLYTADSETSVPLDPVLKSLIFSSGTNLHVSDTAAMPSLKIDGWMTQH